MRLRTSSFAPTVNWRVLESNSLISIDNIEEIPGSGASLEVSGGKLVSTNGDMTIGGNVGIGTTSPSSKLDVNGTTTSSLFKMTTGASSGYLPVSGADGTMTWKSKAEADIKAASDSIGNAGYVTNYALNDSLSNYWNKQTITETDTTRWGQGGSFTETDPFYANDSVKIVWFSDLKPSRDSLEYAYYVLGLHSDSLTWIADTTYQHNIRILNIKDTLQYYRLLTNHDSLSNLDEKSYFSLDDLPNIQDSITANYQQLSIVSIGRKFSILI